MTDERQDSLADGTTDTMTNGMSGDVADNTTDNTTDNATSVPRDDKTTRIAKRGVLLFVAVMLSVLSAFGIATRCSQGIDTGGAPSVTASSPSSDDNYDPMPEPSGSSHGTPAIDPSSIRKPDKADATDEAPVEPVTVSVAEVGDVLMHMRVIESGYTDNGYDFAHLFSNVTGEMGKSDIRAVNQETPIAGSEFGNSGYPAFNGPFEVGDAEASLGVNLILKATNHTFDQGYDGIRKELGLWSALHPEVAVIGAADPDGDGICPAGGCSPAGPYVYERDGLRIACLNYTDVLNMSIDAQRDPTVLGIADDARIREDVQWARKVGKADAIVVFVHWGEEYVEEPVESQRRLADLFLELGVDAVIGGHAHVIQPVEVMERGDGHRMVVFWSTGNFTSTQTNNRNMIGLLAKVDITKDADGTRVTSYEAMPTVTHRAYGQAFTTYLLRDYTDDLAYANLINGIDPEGFSVGWCQRYCQRILGDGYDAGSSSLSVTL